MVAILITVARKGLTEKVTSNYRPEGGESYLGTECYRKRDPASAALRLELVGAMPRRPIWLEPT